MEVPYSFMGSFLACGFLVALLRQFFLVPSELRHLPRVSVPRLLLSYLTGEVENERLRRLVLPFASERGEGVVLVWALGRWMVHILDPNLARIMSDNIDLFPKEAPPDDLMLWRLVGRSNILMSNGAQWKMHSRVVRSAISRAIPVEQFAALTRRLITVIGTDTVVNFDDLAQRFALDAVGTTAFGHDFDAIAQESPFAREYNGIMHAIANPLYLIFPTLERLLPRRALMKTMDTFVDGFKGLLQAKRENPGVDMMTFMLKEVEMSDRELRDNMVLLFIAGHDTSAGGISTLIYYMARNPDIQARARDEVLSVLGYGSDPTVNSLKQMPYLNACVNEALRINTPISYIVPRTTSMPVSLGNYSIPAHASLIFNIYVIHHNPRDWAEPEKFDPERFLLPDMNWKERGLWVPFAQGPRQCPARSFALHEQLILTALLLREYEWTLPSDSIHLDSLKNAFSPFALSIPRDLTVKFACRK
ncbi:hypothetical protein EVG20_g7409 [Dentipellis fragilis]|uniref:Cytochrome P450 n=1 Tax=Dentipellis fragilis TaxID=205917 RepID=A0A4Y9YDP6_9AGAM|nr:hypothetical protein EVG20_g7409 [Dentipellis fragilis]